MIQTTTVESISLGATPLPNGRWQFLVWAPKRERVELRLLTPRERLLTLRREDRGYHQAVVDGIGPGTRYLWRLPDGRELPDPASRFQPQGVHGASQVVDVHAFQWNDAGCRGLLLDDYIIYELHVSTYTPEGTFDAIILHLDELLGSV